MNTANESLLAQRRYRELWERSLPIVKHTLKRLLSQSKIQEITDDMLQDCYLVAGKAVRSWQPAKGAFSTWVSHNAARAAIEHQRRSFSGMVGGSRYPGHTEPLDEDRMEAPKADIVDKLLRKQNQERIMRVLATLPDNDAKMLRGRYGLGAEPRSILELATDRKIAPRTLKLRLREVLMRIAPMLAPLTQQGDPHESRQTRFRS